MPQPEEGKAACTLFQGKYDMSKRSSLFGRLLCWLGFHNFRVIDKTFEFSGGGGIERLECQRCGVIKNRLT